MNKIIAVTNQKGGVGKTTTATTLAVGLHQKGYRVLLVDTDPQGNASDTYGVETDCEHTVYTLLSGESGLDQVVQQTALGAIIPGDLRMSAADMQFVRQGREYLLQKALQPSQQDYDYIILDTPPALGILTINALTAADGLIIPMVADRYSMQGLSQLSDTIQTVQEYSNPDLKVLGILLTRFNRRTVLGRDIQDTIEELAQEWGTKVYATPIRQSVALPESQTQRESIFSYAPESTTSEDYIGFLKEFLEDMDREDKS